MTQQSDQPFFLYFAYQAPHTPCTPPDFIKGKSDAGVRGDMVVELDWAVAELRQTLEDLGVAGKTLIFLSSDNGGLTVGPKVWENHPPEKYDLVHNGHKPNGDLRGQKGDAYEGGHRVPFIAHWPGHIQAGQTTDELISLTDFMATCAAIVGEPLLPNAGEDSFNLLPVLLNTTDEKPIREAVVAQSSAGYFTIQRGEWKLINGLGSGGFSFPSIVDGDSSGERGQLYHLKTDPGEMKNLWDEHPDIVKELIDMLERYQHENRSRSM